MRGAGYGLRAERNIGPPEILEFLTLEVALDPGRANRAIPQGDAESTTLHVVKLSSDKR